MFFYVCSEIFFYVRKKKYVDYVKKNIADFYEAGKFRNYRDFALRNVGNIKWKAVFPKIFRCAGFSIKNFCINQ